MNAETICKLQQAAQYALDNLNEAKTKKLIRAAGWFHAQLDVSRIHLTDALDQLRKERQALIDAGKLWTVSVHDKERFAGSKSAAIAYMRRRNLYRAWKRGEAGVSFGQVIWEQEPESEAVTV